MKPEILIRILDMKATIESYGGKPQYVYLGTHTYKILKDYFESQIPEHLRNGYTAPPIFTYDGLFLVLSIQIAPTDIYITNSERTEL
jgi:hypothetical protein